MCTQTAYEQKLETAIRLFMKNHRSHRCVLAKTVRQFDMPHFQHRMLMLIAKNDKKLSQKQIADESEISTAAVARMLKELENNGYIQRCASSTDNRVNEITLTEKGRQTVDMTESYFKANDVSMFNGFTEQELDQYIYLLNKIENNLHELQNSITTHQIKENNNE